MTAALRRRSLVMGMAGGLGAPFLARPARGQSGWPAQMTRLVVPYTPGGSNDAIARPLADGLQSALGKPAMVENRPGAASTIGAAYVANAAPDGHTLLLVSSSFVTSSLVRRTPYDILESFEPVARVCTAPMLVVSKPRGAYRDMRELVAAARARPGHVQYGTAGLGGIGHMTMEGFNAAASLKMEVVPYSGISPSQADLLSGRIDFLITTLASVSNLISANQAPVIASTGEQRMAQMPEVPTLREATGIDYDVDVWWGILAPKGVPRAIRQRLNQVINDVVATPSYQRFLAVEGARPMPTDIDGFGQAMRHDVGRWREVARSADIKDTGGTG